MAESDSISTAESAPLQITYNGETKTLTEWAATLGIKRRTLYTRLVKRKWSPEWAFTKAPLLYGGWYGTPTYVTWKSMMSRCYNRNDSAYARYGGRGIKVCDRWKGFFLFLADMGPRPSADHSIDRYPDNGGNYEPGNCRWATPVEQGRNRYTNRLVTFNGITATFAEWEERTGINQFTLHTRIVALHWTPEQALTTPVHGSSEAVGDLITAREAARRLGVSIKRLRRSCIKGLMPSVRIGKGFYLKASDLEKWRPMKIGRQKKR